MIEEILEEGEIFPDMETVDQAVVSLDRMREEEAALRFKVLSPGYPRDRIDRVQVDRVDEAGERYPGDGRIIEDVVAG